MEPKRFSTSKLFFRGLILFIMIQLSHILSLIILAPLEPVYGILSGNNSLRGKILSLIAEWYLLFLTIAFLLIAAALLLEFSDLAANPLKERIILLSIGIFIICAAVFFQIWLVMRVSTWYPGFIRERFVLHAFGMLIVFIPLFSIGLSIIKAAKLLPSSSQPDVTSINQDLKFWIPGEIKSAELFKIGGMLAGSGILFFNIFLLLKGNDHHTIPIFDDWAILSEFLLVSLEVILLGMALLLLAGLLDTTILPGLDPKQRNLKEQLWVTMKQVRSTNKTTIIGFSVLMVILLFLEEGLLLQRLQNEEWIVLDLVDFIFEIIGSFVNPLLAILGINFRIKPFFEREEQWIIDPLLDFFDTLAEWIGSIFNPILETTGVNFRVKPLFTEGDYTRSDPALWRVIFRWLAMGAEMTLLTSLVGLFFGFFLGTLCGTVRVTSHIPIPFVGRRISHWLTALLQRIATAFVEFFRGTPLMAQVFFIWVGIPALIKTGIPFPFISWSGGPVTIYLLHDSMTHPIGVIRDSNFRFRDPIAAGILALALNTAAYQSEIVRSGIQAIPSGQLEAARSLGMPYSQGMRHVVLPQAFRLIIPPLTNEFINLLLNSSILSVISIFDMTRKARNLNNRTFRSFEVFAGLMFMYFAMTYVLSRIFRRLEERFKIPGLGVS
ncbi:MAG: amino acid ABC transporter permease [Candidatus Hodarchaeota archaeon]